MYLCVGAENVGAENVGAENVGAENVGAENVQPLRVTITKFKTWKINYE